MHKKFTLGLIQMRCGVDPAATLAELRKPGQWMLLARGIRDPSAIAALRDLTQQPGLRAVTLETRWVREYPRGSLLAPMIGWTGFDDPKPAKTTKDGKHSAEPLFPAVESAPHGRPVGRLDEVRAARRPIVRYRFEQHEHPSPAGGEPRQLEAQKGA